MVDKEQKQYRLTCLQVHNDYLIPGGETKTAQRIADLLESYGIKVIRYYKSKSAKYGRDSKSEEWIEVFVQSYNYQGSK